MEPSLIFKSGIELGTKTRFYVSKGLNLEPKPYFDFFKIKELDLELSS